jgi:hypothetical protein
VDLHGWTRNPTHFGSIAGRGGGIKTRLFQEEVRNTKLLKWSLIWGTGFSIKNGK